MQCVLNFSEDRKEVLEFLRGFPCLEAKSQHEMLRCKIGESVVTLYKSGKVLIQGEDCEKVKERVLAGVKVEDELVVGIDETGRGEGFGPFVVAGVLARPSSLRELRDSKKVKDLEGKMKIVDKNALGIAIVSFSSEELSLMHEEGKTLNEIEARAINEICSFLGEKAGNAKIVVDGSQIKGCPERIVFLVRGDDLNPVVGAASVVAKSVREKSEDKGKRRDWGNWGKDKKQ